MSKAVLTATVLAFGALCACALAACSRQPGNFSAATSLRGCVRDDQCDDSELCVFRLCTPRCDDARSCDHGAACFDTGRGAACLLREYNACVDDTDCPTTAACRNKRCTSDCEPDAGEACGDCLNGLCLPGGSSAMSTDAGTTDAGATSACPPATSQCRDGVVVQCDRAGQPQPREACPFACKDGTCVGSCKPGELRCDALVRQQCDDTGTWKPLETCRTMCMPDACETACVNGTRQCNDDMLMVCRGGRMVALNSCNYVCRSGACTGSCTPGTHQCRSNAVVTCDANGAWAMPVDCPNACSEGVCTGECAPSSQRCAGATAFQTCDRRGQWSASSECRQGACVEGTCAGVCTPGATQCEGGVALSTCGANGQWGAPVQCPAQACEVGMCLDACPPENLRCLPSDPAQPQVCSAGGRWENAPRCAPTQACVEGVCRGECATGARRCSPDDPRNFQTCGDTGEWQPAVPCGDEQRCAGEGVCGLGNMCPTGESPQWWSEGEFVDHTPADPRWGGMLETFANGEQSMPAGYAIVFDRQANELAVTLRTSADDNAAESDFAYFGITGSAMGTTSPRAVRIALVTPTGTDDPRMLSQFTSYEFVMGMWTSTNTPPMWITHPAAWVTTAEPGWVVSFRVDLTAAGVDIASPFRIALGLHAENEFGALSWATPESLELSDLAATPPRIWPYLDLTSVMCVSRVDVP
jgi:hypothetical protein